jgi:hypothetical protein
MNLFRNPAWIDNLRFPYHSFEDIPLSVFEKVNADLDKVLSEQPLVSVVVAAWNEEVNILNCVASLSQSQSGIPFEIVVVNNNSTDNTQQTLDKLHVKSYFQEIQGWGPARQLGLEKARGKYVLLADADCFYPPYWMHEMMEVLQQPGVVCVYGRYSFISEPGYPRWKLYLLEKMKDAIAEVRHIKRPYLNAYGMSMGYIREYGLKAGYVMRKIRGEDGRMCFDLMQYGKVKQVKADRARVWTWTRTLQQEGSVTKAIFTRIRKELGRLGDLFKTPPPHDTKTSTN